MIELAISAVDGSGVRSGRSARALRRLRGALLLALLAGVADEPRRIQQYASREQ